MDIPPAQQPEPAEVSSNLTISRLFFIPRVAPKVNTPPTPSLQELPNDSIEDPSIPIERPNSSNKGYLESLSSDELRQALSEWEDAFEEERQEGGAFSGIIGRIQPLTVVNEVRRALNAERQARAETAALRQRLAAAAAEAAARAQDDVMLRKELLAARTAAEPSVLQLRQLLLEPAVNREFSRLSSATAAATLEATALKNDMRIMHEVANNPNGPRALAAQVRTLEEKVQELEKAAEEGATASLERALDMAKSQLEEMRYRYGGEIIASLGKFPLILMHVPLISSHTLPCIL